MANRIEITVSGRNEMPVTFAEVKAQAEVFGQGVGADAGSRFAGSFTDTINDAIPAGFEKAAPKIEDPVKASGKSSGAAFTSAFSGEVASGLSGTGVFGGSLGDALGKEGDPAGRKFTANFSAAARDEMTRASVSGILSPGSPEGARVVENAKSTAVAAGKGMSPLLTGAIATGLAVGAPAILAGFGALMGGLALIADRGDKVIASDLSSLGTAAEAAVQKAAAPLSGTLHAALTMASRDVTALAPQLGGLFAAAEPDLAMVVAGVDNFAKGVLPGLTSALSSSQGIVQDFSNSLGPLGQGVGGFFTGLTRDAYTTGAGMESLLGTVGHLASTLGGVLGSAASVGSTALMGLDPVLNTTLSAIDRIANPGTVGALVGVFGAMKLGGETGALTTGLEKAASGLGTFAKDAGEGAGAMGLLKGAAGGVGSALGKAAEFMSGPWGIAIGAGVGLATGLAGALINASHASDALTLSQQGLDQAVAKDGSGTGQATAAYIAATAASNGLSDTYQKAGVTTAQWTEAVLGNATAQKQVIDTITKANQVQQNQQLTTDENAKSTGKFSSELQGATTVVQANAAANNQLTDANQQVINSLNAETKQVADAIAAQTKYQQAMASVTSTEMLFNATLTAGYHALVANSQATALDTVAALDLGSSSYDLNHQLYMSVDAYDQATAEGSAYLQVLDSLSGTTNALLGTEAAFTTHLGRLSSAVKTNSTDLDVNHTKGAANITMFTQIASAADKAAAAVYDNEVSTKGATAAYNDANQKLAQEKAAFIAAADEAGFNKGAVQALANELYRLPANIPIHVNVMTTGLGNLNDALHGNAGGHAYGGAVSFAAGGGAQGGFTWMNEQGPELVKLPTGAMVMPASNTASMLARGGGGGGVQRIQLEWAPGGGADDFFKFLRKNIRVRGGDVQQVLGAN